MAYYGGCEASKGRALSKFADEDKTFGNSFKSAGKGIRNLFKGKLI